MSDFLSHSALATRISFIAYEDWDVANANKMLFYVIPFHNKLGNGNNNKIIL